MFEKNKKIAVFSLPFPKADLPQGHVPLRTLLVPEWKETECPTIWEPRIRECIIGTPQKKYVDFDSSYSPVADGSTVKCQLAVSAATNMFIFVVDIKNAFQNTFAQLKDRKYVTTPPTYLEWLKHEEGFAPEPSVSYLRIMLNSNQGQRDAGNQWWQLLRSSLKDYGLHPSPVDHAFFVKNLDDEQRMFVSVATDDLLCSVPSTMHADDFIKFLQQFFTLTIQLGAVLKFLGLRIVQSSHAISIDQGNYIFQALTKYFGSDVDKVKTVSTPMRYDNEFEKELMEAAPLSQAELLQYAKDYRGTYRYHTGTLSFAACQTRVDIKFAVQRLSEYNNHPIAVGFQAIGRIYRYLARDPLRPIVYPRAPITGKSKISYLLTPGQSVEMEIPNGPINFNDAELGRCLKTRCSYYCTMVLVLGVVVQMKVKKTTSPMTHTTDAEMKANFEGCRHLIPIRNLFAYMGLPFSSPSKLYCDNKAVFDVIESERMTPRCRHFDIPIAFLHAHKNHIFTPQLVPTDRMLADIGTKPNTPATFKRLKYWITGERFLPVQGHEHYDHLEMQFYEMDFHEILKIMKDLSSFQNISVSEYFSRRGGSCDVDHTGIRNPNPTTTRHNIPRRICTDRDNHS